MWAASARVSHSFSFTHWHLCLWVNWTMCLPKISTAHSFSSETMRQRSNWSMKDEARFEACDANAPRRLRTVDLRVNLNNGQFLIKYVWTSGSACVFFSPKGTLTKLQFQSLLKLAHDVNTMIQRMSSVFRTNPYCCTADTFHQTMVQQLTEAECLVKIWESILLKFIETRLHSEWFTFLGSIAQTWFGGHSM